MYGAIDVVVEVVLRFAYPFSWSLAIIRVFNDLTNVLCYGCEKFTYIIFCLMFYVLIVVAFCIDWVSLVMEYSFPSCDIGCSLAM